MKVPVHVTGHRHVAQSIVEFALVAPVFFLAIWVIIEVAHLVFAFNSVSMASREAARYAAGMSRSVSTGLAQWQDCQGIRSAAIRVGSIMAIQAGDIQIDYDHGPGTTSTLTCNPNPVSQLVNGDRITVTVTVRYSLLVPLANLAPIPLTSRSSHTILTGIPVGQ